MILSARLFGAFLFSFLFSLAKTIGQSVLDTPASLHINNAPIPQALVALGKNCGVELAFSERFFDEKQKIALRVENVPIKAILAKILDNTGIGFKEVEGQIVLFLLPKKEPEFFTLSGYVDDAETGERLIAAAIFCPELGKGTVTNEYGFYSLTLPEGASDIFASYIGYNEHKNPLAHHANQRLDLHLKPSLTLTEILVLPTNKPGDLLPSPTGLRRLKPDDFKAQPDLGGQSDLLRTLQMLPGVQSGADGVGGMFVRGGNADQNLVLMDGVPVYNADHLLGLFSIFNTSAIRSAKLLKGGFPARYGGRLSSVLDVYTKEGNQNKWGGEAASDLISARATVEGPFLKKKGALMISGRHTHSDFYLEPATLRLLDIEDEFQPSYHFFDFNAKLNYALSEKDKLFASFYTGNDVFKGVEDYIFEDETTKYEGTTEIRIDWGNTITSLRWNHLYNQELFSNTTLTYSHFKFSMGLFDQETTTYFGEEEPPFSYQSFLGLQSEIKDIALKTDFDFAPLPNHYLRFGIGGTLQQFRPNLTTYSEEFEYAIQLDSFDLEDFFGDQGTKKAVSVDAYLEDEMRVGEKWLFNLGLRLSGFLSSGKNYFYPEPRLSAAYLVGQRSKLTASISRCIQYLHRMPTLPFYFPADYWQPSNDKIKPQRAWQATLGMEGMLSKRVEFSLEGFYKNMQGLGAFPDTFYYDPFFNEDPLEEVYITGCGTSYGMDLLLRKQEGLTGGWIGYGLSHSTRQFEGQNGGRAYPFTYDRRHEVKLFLFRRLGEHWQASMNWQYGSPNPQLLADNEGDYIPPGTKNLERSTAYHRLDLAISFNIKTGKVEHLLKASIYNAYNRKNVAFYYLRYDQNGLRSVEPTYLFGMMPGVNYSVKF